MLVVLGLLAGSLNPGGVEVSLPTRADCPTAEVVAGDIEALVGAQAPAIAVNIALTDVPQGVVAHVRYSSGGQERTRSIPGPTCVDVVGAAAVVVAVGVDPIAVQHVVLQRPSRPPPALPETVEVPALPPPSATPPTESPSRTPEPPAPSRDVASAPRRPSLAGFVRGGGAVGGLSRPGGWIGGGLALGVRALRVEVSGQHLFALRVRHPAQSASGADVSMTSGRAGLCWAPRVGAFTVAGCAGGDLGVARGSGFGLAQRDAPASIWGAVTPGLRAHWWPSKRVQLGLVVDVPISVVRPRFTIDDFEAPLMRVGQVAVWGGLSVGFTFFDESRAGRR